MAKVTICRGARLMTCVRNREERRSHPRNGGQLEVTPWSARPEHLNPPDCARVGPLRRALTASREARETAGAPSLLAPPPSAPLASEGRFATAASCVPSLTDDRRPPQPRPPRARQPRAARHRFVHRQHSNPTACHTRLYILCRFPCQPGLGAAMSALPADTASN